MIDDQLCVTREPIEQLISVELFASCAPPLAQFPPLSLRLFRLTISSLQKDETYYTIIPLVLTYYRLKNEIYYIHS